MGLLFLAAATELPEIATTLTAALRQNADLVLGNMFGGITMQTAILAIADLVAAKVALTSYPRKTTTALEGALLVVLLALLLALAMLGDRVVALSVGGGAAALAFAYGAAILLLRRYDENTAWVPVEIVPVETGPVVTGPAAEPAPQRAPGAIAGTALEALSWPALNLRVALAVAAILIGGIVLVSASEALADQTGLGNSFIGVTVLAASTSLPELSTTIAAVRLGAYTMAISNIFGSNLIMLALILPADALYRGGPILNALDETALFAILSGILVTAIYVVGLLVRHKPRLLGMGIDSVLVVAVYLATLLVFYAKT
jgi:cation:H+ antiporter